MRLTAPSLGDLQCRVCGSTDIASVRPGTDPIIDATTDIVISRGEPTTALCRACLLVGAPSPQQTEEGTADMPKRVRGPGDNVTDELRMQAIAACTITKVRVEETAAEAKTARAEHSNELKKWKGLGINIPALKDTLNDRFIDPQETIAKLHEYTRFRALQNMPTIQDELMKLWAPIEEDPKEAAQRQRWHDDGAFTGREGGPRDANPHQAGSEAYQAWDDGWLHDQKRIANELGANSNKPAVNNSRTRPERQKEAAPKKAAANGTGRPRGRPRKDQQMQAAPEPEPLPPGSPGPNIFDEDTPPAGRA